MTSFMCINCNIKSYTHMDCLLFLQTNTSSPTHTHTHTHTHKIKVSRIDMNEHWLVGVLKYCRYVVVVKLKHPPAFFFPALYLC